MSSELSTVKSASGRIATVLSIGDTVRLRIHEYQIFEVLENGAETITTVPEAIWEGSPIDFACGWIDA